MSAVLADPPAPEAPGPAPAPQTVELKLRPSRGMQRELNVRVDTDGRVRCHMNLISRRKGYVKLTMIAWASAQSLQDCRFDRDSLWVGRAAFDVTPDEARQITERFAPLGLKIIEPAAEASVS